MGGRHSPCRKMKDRGANGAVSMKFLEKMQAGGARKDLEFICRIYLLFSWKKSLLGNCFFLRNMKNISKPLPFRMTPFAKVRTLPRLCRSASGGVPRVGREGL